MQLGTITAPLNLHLYRGPATLAQIGLSLLLLTSLGMIAKVVENVHKKRQTLVRPFIIYLQALILGVAFILGIVGAMTVPDSDFVGITTTKVPLTLVASTNLYIISFAFLCSFAASLWLDIRYIEPPEQWILVAVTSSLPFLLVRIVYSALCMFRDDMRFHWFKGSLLILIVMSSLMEVLVAVIYEAGGILAGRRLLSKTTDGRATKAKDSVKNNDQFSCFSDTSLAV